MIVYAMSRLSRSVGRSRASSLKGGPRGGVRVPGRAEAFRIGRISRKPSSARWMRSRTMGLSANRDRDTRRAAGADDRVHGDHRSARRCRSRRLRARRRASGRDLERDRCAVLRSKSSRPASIAALTKPRDYERFAGMRARVVTSLSIDGSQDASRRVARRARSRTSSSRPSKGELPLPIATIKSANLEYDPRADFQRDKRERKGHPW